MSQTPKQITPNTNVTDSVLQKVTSLEKLGELHLPSNYSAANSLKAAWIVLQDVQDRNHKPALEVCSRESIAMALFNMATQGLSVSKKQCYFIVYGKELQFTPSYFGTVAIAKRTAGVKTVSGQVVYEGDEFKYGIDLETGFKKVIDHSPKLENINNDKIVGAYAIITYEDGTTKADVMSMAQIRKSWLQGSTKGQSPAHKNFPDQMAIRSVINRALKMDNASSDDSHLNIDDDGSIDKSTQPNKEEVVEEINIQEAEVVSEEKPQKEAESSDSNNIIEPEF